MGMYGLDYYGEDRRRDFANKVMNLRIPQSIEQILSSCQLAAWQEGLFSIK
jgi:hypothetical protein